MSCEDRIYNEINRLYPKINEIKKNNIFSYSEVSEEQQTPIPVTAIVDDEYNLSSGVLQTYQNWTIPNDVDTCFYNAQKTYSKKKYDDMTEADLKKGNYLVVMSRNKKFFSFCLRFI